VTWLFLEETLNESRLEAMPALRGLSRYRARRSSSMRTRALMGFLLLHSMLVESSPRRSRASRTTASKDAARKRYEFDLKKHRPTSPEFPMDCETRGECEKLCVLAGKKSAKKRIALWDAKQEGLASGRRLPTVDDNEKKSKKLVKRTALLELIGEPTARYFNLIHADASVPNGVYIIGREGASREKFNISRVRLAGSQFRSASYFAPISIFEEINNRTFRGAARKFAAVAFRRVGLVLDNWSMAHNLATTFLTDESSTKQVLGVGGARSAGNTDSRLHTLLAPNVASVLTGDWLLRRGAGDEKDARCDVRRRGAIPTALDGAIATSGCVDARAMAGHCRFDGKHSIVATPSGTLLRSNERQQNTTENRATAKSSYLLYSRSNLRERGGRFVQVATAPSLDALTNRAMKWSPYRLIEFRGRDLQKDFNRSDFNIYFSAVNANPVGSKRSLLGLFAVAEGRDAGYVGVAVSCDGVHFSELRILVRSAHVREGRPYDMPVDGILKVGNRIFALVHRNVPNVMSLADRQQPSMIALHELDAENLLAYTNSAIQELGEHCGGS